MKISEKLDLCIAWRVRYFSKQVEVETPLERRVLGVL